MSDWKAAKDAGNAAYQGGNTKEAVAQYTVALQADEVPSTDRATLLANRAAAYLKIGDHQNAIEDCTACLTHAPDNTKALFRRATAYEQTGEVRDALRDYQRAITLSPGLGDAVAGVNRCEQALGIKPARKAAAGAMIPAPRGGAPPGRGGGFSVEEQKVFGELQERVREVAVAKLRATEQYKAAMSEKKKADLTIAQVTPLPEDRPVYTALGRMFVRSPKAEVLAQVTTLGLQADRKTQVCTRTLEHLGGQEKEADDAFQEFMAALNKKLAPGMRRQ